MFYNETTSKSKNVSFKRIKELLIYLIVDHRETNMKNRLEDIYSGYSYVYLVIETSDTYVYDESPGNEKAVMH